MTPGYEFGSGLKAIREENGLSIEEMARKLNLFTPHYEKYENGELRLPIAIGELVVKVFKVSPLKLLGINPSMPKDYQPMLMTSVYSLWLAETSHPVTEKDLEKLREMLNRAIPF